MRRLFVLCMFLFSVSLSAASVPLSLEAKTVKAGIYQHYKGALYEVIGIAHHSETLEEYVSYRLLYGDFGYWIRPLSLFVGNVENEQHEMVPRFRYIGEPGDLGSNR